ncbi:hypothetical protein EYF80_027380 [Liparis tanakae]|uniref:Uncharacterized protein n=1 Tax=Liparis tanakae TaxID=230148 RepID=A0A4Z2H975_9TELE|nr:hypothetical protein EYF80_027380 [Liparis tanakae]
MASPASQWGGVPCDPTGRCSHGSSRSAAGTRVARYPPRLSGTSQLHCRETCCDTGLGRGGSEVSVPITGPSQASVPITGPSEVSVPIRGPSQASVPITGPSQVSVPITVTAR